MQSRYFKRLLSLTAVALLILAFLVIELEGPPGPCERKYERREQLATTQTEYLQYIEVTERARAIRPKYNNLFWRQPNVWSVGIGLFVDENGDFLEVPDGEGGCTKVVGFRITVTEKVDQNTLPLEDRIPDMLEGVPVQIIETPNDWLVPNQ